MYYMIYKSHAALKIFVKLLFGVVTLFVSEVRTKSCDTLYFIKILVLCSIKHFLKTKYLYC